MSYFADEWVKEKGPRSRTLFYYEYIMWGGYWACT